MGWHHLVSLLGSWDKGYRHWVPFLDLWSKVAVTGSSFGILGQGLPSLCPFFGCWDKVPSMGPFVGSWEKLPSLGSLLGSWDKGFHHRAHFWHLEWTGGCCRGSWDWWMPSGVPGLVRGSRGQATLSRLLEADNWFIDVAAMQRGSHIPVLNFTA